MVHGGLKAFEEEGSAQKTKNIQNITYKKQDNIHKDNWKQKYFFVCL